MNNTPASITLRPLTLEDYPAWYTGYAKRLPSQHPYDEGAIDMAHASIDTYAAMIRYHATRAQAHEEYILGIFSSLTHEHLGMVSINILDTDLKWAELGYQIHNHQWRKGYGYAALQAAIERMPELSIRRLEAYTYEDNLASRSLLAKAGFELEGIRRSFLYDNGIWNDQHVYVYINEDIV
ncbi:MAG: GNAT family N-acetyltransferase [Rothia sp. (in: high G+C Gram-positive bacteria)]|uniref:GNAT family N-acetyltransferase n=1 Tax=Rothia sp. (in: high G+C Gram-positive bacteria) TaxID=1885016 RepID=UPI0026DFC89F|nr:GNAT family N-acetyltransferase [Rothia sp. (in: high G+C Gram-positive bacteria)]MDO5751216.1 GNAT family N-acetyltransferase [Rothia sp. (in: high G+C Gram-positive bacteria)]